MAWDLNDLRSEVTRARGKSASFRLSAFLDSIFERQEFARYHYHEAKDSLEPYMDKTLPEMALFRLAIAGEGEDRDLFLEKKFKARANVLACVQSLHAVSDILGHTIYYGLDLNNAKNERDISIHKVARWLQVKPDYSSLHALLGTLLANDDYIYMCALANHSKHRSIVTLGLSFNFQKVGNEMKELVFPRFSYGGNDYPQRKVFEFLESEFDRQIRLVVDIGNELNALAKKLR